MAKKEMGMSYVALISLHLGFMALAKGDVISPLDAEKIGNAHLQDMLDKEQIDEAGEVEFERPAPEPTAEELAKAQAPAPKKKSKKSAEPVQAEETTQVESSGEDESKA